MNPSSNWWTPSCTKTPAAGLDCLHKALDRGSDARQYARQVVDYLRDLLLIKLKNQKQIDATADMLARMQQHAGAFSHGALNRDHQCIQPGSKRSAVRVAAPACPWNWLWQAQSTFQMPPPRRHQHQLRRQCKDPLLLSRWTTNGTRLRTGSKNRSGSSAGSPR